MAAQMRITGDGVLLNALHDAVPALGAFLRGDRRDKFAGSQQMRMCGRCGLAERGRWFGGRFWSRSFDWRFGRRNRRLR